MKKMFTSGKFALVLLAVALSSSFTMRADDFQWTGGGAAGDWTDINNFFDVTASGPATFAPGPTDNVEIPSPFTASLDGAVGAGGAEINNLTVDAGATLTVFDFAGVFIDGFYSNLGSSVVSDDGTFVYLASTAAENDGNLILENGGHLELDGTGLIFSNTGTVNIDGLSQLIIYGDFYNSGSVVNTDGTTPSSSSITGAILMQGPVNATITGGGYIDNLVLNSSTSNVSIGTATTDTVHIKNMLVIANDTFFTNNRLVLSANTTNTTGTGMIGDIESPAALIGGVTVSQYIPGGQRAFRFYSHPFTAPVALSQVENGIDITGVNGATNGFTPTASNNPSAMWFNAATGNDDSTAGTLDPGWNFFANTTSTSGVNSFQQYEGINLLMRGAKGEGLDGGTYTPSATTITIYGDAVNTGTQTITLHTGPHGTFNMIGNPYPCVIDLGDLLANGSNAPSLGSSSFFVWDPYSGTQGAYTTIVSGAPYLLQPNTAFQVESASADGQTLTFQETNKFTDLGSNPELLRQQNPVEKNQMVQLKVYDAAYHPYDMFYLQLTNTATNGKEKADAGKPSNPDFNLFSVASTGEHLAVDARPYVAGDVIPMGVNATKPQTFIIRAEENYAPAGTVLYLHDKYMGVYTQLLQGEEYKFDITTDPNSQGGNRFELRMGDVTSTETVKAATGLSINVTPNPATAEINVAYNAQATGNTTIRITNMMGQQVYTTALGAQQGGNVTVPVTAIPAGMYMVTLSCGDKTTTQRFVKE